MLNIQSKLPGIGTTIFSVMSNLAQEHNAINLSQGFPDFGCDNVLTELVKKAMKDGHHQYAPMAGNLKLREIISNKVENLYQTQYDPDTEITITAGATQAIFTAIASCINVGDEVIIFEPAYDCYAPIVKLFGGLVKAHKLIPPYYEIDWEMVTKLFTAKTKMIILNSPHNPTGSILSQSDLENLARIIRGTDIVVLSDEVYEHLVYDDHKHQSVMLHPELKDRSFIVASFGKLLHTTGWKVGYCLAPAYLMNEFKKVHQFNVFSVNSVMQQAIAGYLVQPSRYLDLSDLFQKKRDLFRSQLADSKFQLLPCHGSYFQCVNYGKISNENDIDFCNRLITQYGVAAVPLSAFYQKGSDHKIIRFCFAKKEATLMAATKKLKAI